jgi:lipopolysaccharide transport system ATP-binding protein
VSIAIAAQGLSKRYILRRGAAAGPYVALRDVLAAQAGRLVGRAAVRDEELWALRDVSFEIAQGERIGIIGRNGAGKSTLLKLLSRVTLPTRGRAAVTGRVGSLLEVGTGFHPELTGRENVFLNGAILGMRRDEVAAKFDDIVGFAGVERFLETPVKHFSSGMAVRLAFAVAAHLEPEILVIDEVLAVGDAEFQKRCIDRMEALTREGRTLLFVSHNLGTISALCDKCMLLEQGGLKMYGQTAAVIARYSRPNLRSHTAEILPGQRVKGDGSVRFASARLSDAQGESRTAFLIGEDLRLEVEVESVRSNAVSFWLIIYDAAGRPLLSTHQRDREDLVRIEPGRFRLTYETVGLGLMPGSYTIGAGAFDAGLGFLEWVDHFQSFEVQPAFRNGTPFDQRWGAVDQTARWRLERA